AIVTTQERVRGGAAAIVLRAACELPEHSARWVVALRGGDPREKVGCGPAVGLACVRIQRDRRDDEFTVGVGADRCVRARLQGWCGEVLLICGKGHAQIADRDDRTHTEPPRPKLAGAPRSVEADAGPARALDDLGAGREPDRLCERTERRPVRHGGGVIGRDDEAPRTIAVNCAEHRSENRWAAEGPASLDLEVEAVHESVSELALPVDVRPGGAPGAPNRRAELPACDLLAHARLGSARAVA